MSLDTDRTHSLEREGIPFKTFASVIEVMQALQHSQPQVLVSDIRMPGESGLALLGKIKERHPRVPVIIMTAYSDLDSAVAAFQGGAFEYLPKPFDDTRFDFYSRTMQDVQSQPERWKRGVRLLNDYLGEAVGELYAQHHWTADTDKALSRSTNVCSSSSGGSIPDSIARSLRSWPSKTALRT